MSMKPGGVLITDGNERASLAVTRSLGSRGIPVFVGSESRTSLAGSSRYCARSFVYPSPWREPEAYVACLADMADKSSAAAIFPMTDIAMELIGEHRNVLNPAIALPVPSLDQYRRLSDKYHLTDWAGANGIPVPRTYFVPDGEIDDLVGELTAWPVVVKPGRSLLKRDGTWKKTVVSIARDADDLRRLYHEAWYLRQPSMIQQHVTGHGEGVFGLFESGVPKRLFAHRRLRERPPSGGVSVLREAIALPEPMTDYAVRIMKDARWDGIAMVEFKVDQQSGVPYLMEVNGRFWGSLQLAVDAGVDFPTMLYEQAVSQTLPGDHESYRVGTRSQWWLGDLDHLLVRLRRGSAEASLPKGTPSRRRTFFDLINIFDASVKNEVFRPFDQGPGIFELTKYLASKFSGGRQKLAYRLRRWRRALSYGASDIKLGLAPSRRALEARLPRDAKNILVLCKGNICRSPFADLYLRQAARNHGLDLEISSAGLDAEAGIAAYPMAKTISPHFNVNLDDHRTSAMSQGLVDEADIILVMEPDHVRQIATRFPGAERKTFLLGAFIERRPMTEIKDPYGADASHFERCYTILVDACDGFLRQLQKGAPREPQAPLGR